jgi:hypothetical protein
VSPDEAIDARFSSLGGVEPPPALAAGVLDAWRAERARDARRVRLFAGAGMIAMSALVLLVARDTPIIGVPEHLVERGVGEVLPAVELAVVVESASGESARLVPDQRYAAGCTLHFRVTSSAPTALRLSRDGVELWSGSVPAGSADLPVGYRLEQGEAAARFVLSGGAQTLTLYLPAVAPEASP